MAALNIQYAVNPSHPLLGKSIGRVNEGVWKTNKWIAGDAFAAGFQSPDERRANKEATQLECFHSSVPPELGTPSYNHWQNPRGLIHYSAMTKRAKLCAHTHNLTRFAENSAEQRLSGSATDLLPVAAWN